MFSSRAIAESLRAMAAREDGEVLASKFFAFVERYNLWNLVPHVLTHLESGADVSESHETLKIRVPRALSEEGEEKIRHLVGAKKDVNTEVIIDRSVLGGFIANYKGFEHEGSFKRVVKNLEKSIKQ